MTEAYPFDEEITKEDLQAKFTDLKDSLDSTVESARAPVIATGVVILVVLVLVAFVLGRRRGRASRTVVEVRRV